MADEVRVQASKALSSTNGGQAVGAGADQAILADNHERASFVITNDGAGDAWVWYGAGPAAAHKGHYLAAGTGILFDDEWNGPVRAFAIVATNLCFIEKSFAVGDDEGERPAGADTFVPTGPPGESIPTASLPVSGGGA